MQIEIQHFCSRTNVGKKMKNGRKKCRNYSNFENEKHQGEDSWFHFGLCMAINIWSLWLNFMRIRDRRTQTRVRTLKYTPLFLGSFSFTAYLTYIVQIKIETSSERTNTGIESYKQGKKSIRICCIGKIERCCASSWKHPQTHKYMVYTLHTLDTYIFGSHLSQHTQSQCHSNRRYIVFYIRAWISANTPDLCEYWCFQN